jgi:hypothetical protein
MEELKPLKESRTSIIDRETEDISFEALTLQEPEQKKESAKKILFENNSADRYVEQLKRNSALYSPSVTTSTSTKIEFEAAKSFFTEEPKKEIKSEKMIEQKVEIEKIFEPEIEIEPEIQNIDFTQLENKTENETVEKNEEQSNKRLKPKVNFKARLKIIVFGFVAVLTCFMGWSIYNAVEIETLRAEMEASNKTYAVNIYNYIKNISKANALNDEDSIYNLQELSNAGVVPLEPSALENPSEYTIKSNWFDRLCNWLSGVFK